MSPWNDLGSRITDKRVRKDVLNSQPQDEAQNIVFSSCDLYYPDVGPAVDLEKDHDGEELG